MANTTITPGVGAIALAGVAPTLAANNFGSLPVTDANGTTRVWANVPQAQPGVPCLYASGYRSAFFQATGTFGTGGSVQLEGSNDGVNFYKLSAAALTAPGVFAPLGPAERPKYIRPNVTAGDGTTSITITGFFAPA